MKYPHKSKMPTAAGLAMAVWMILCYFPTHFSPSGGYIARGGLWVPFTLVSFFPVALFLVFAFLLAKKNAKFLLVPWGLHVLFAMPFPVVAFFLLQYYSRYNPALAVYPGIPLWARTAVASLLSAGAMICYHLAVSNRLKRNALPLILTIALPAWSILIRIAQLLAPYRPPAILAIGLPIAYDILGVLPYILLVAGLKPVLDAQEPIQKGGTS